MTSSLNNTPAGQGAARRPWMRLGFVFLLVYFILAATGITLSASDSRKKADALVLLSGGDQARQEEIAWMYARGYSERVILTRTAGASNHTAVQKALAQLGVPGSVVWYAPGRSDSTYDEARHVHELMEGKNLGDAIVVTDPYHALRTRMIFRGEFRQSGRSVWVRSAQAHWYGPLTWMFTLEGWRVTLTEIIKIGAYLVGIKGS